MPDTASTPTCPMAPDHVACTVTWATTATLVTVPGKTAPRHHRCGLVGDHKAHLCACGQMLTPAGRP
jgi:hypothetical protein